MTKGIRLIMTNGSMAAGTEARGFRRTKEYKNLGARVSTFKS